MPLTEDTRRAIDAIEAAALGISGAALTRDVAYACQRHEELLVAAQGLPGLNLSILCLKAGRQLRACARGDQEGARRVALEITRMLAFCS